MIEPTPIQPNFETHLAEAVSEVLEAMCFMELGEQTVTPTGGDAYSIACRLEFSGPYEGSFGLLATPPVATVIACNLVGEDPEEVTPKQISESMAEIANMVCGAVLGRVETRQAFTLTSPYEDPAPLERPEAEGRTIKSFTLEEGVLTTWLEIKRSV